MEKEKRNNNGGLIALIIVLFLLVLGLGGYIVYDKVLSSNNTKPIIDDNNSANSNQQNNVVDNNDEQNSNVINNNEQNNTVSCNCPTTNCNLSLDFDKLAKISKSDYNFVNGAYNNTYSVNVLSNGKVLVNFVNNISNISNAKDVILFSGPGTGDMAYILTADGYIYKYDLSNASKNNFDATKVNEYSNIKQMVRYMTRKANAGGCDYVVLIDNNDKYYSLDSYCV